MNTRTETEIERAGIVSSVGSNFFFLLKTPKKLVGSVDEFPLENLSFANCSLIFNVTATAIP
jgi:hypothetical protein